MVIGGFFLLKRRKTIIHSRWYGKLATVLFVASFAALFMLPAEQKHLAKYIFIVPVGWAIVAYLLYGIRFVIPHIKQKKMV